VLAVVLGVTAVLVNVTPPRSQAGSRIVELRAPTETGEVELLVTPARAGRNQVHVQYTDEAGRAADVATTLSIDLSLPEAGIDPIREQVVKIAPGHFVLDGNDLALPGDWTVTLAVRTDDFTEERTSFTVPVAR
jgi:copper transport protein